MDRPLLRLHPRPLMILVAIVLCLVATMAFSQSRSVTAGTRAAPATGTFTGTPSASGLTSGAATGLTGGMPSASGLTSGSGGATLPSGAPSPSGLTSGSGGSALPGIGSTGSTGVGTTADTTATATGGSTRGVIVLQPDMAAGTTTDAGGATTVVTPGAPGTNGVPSVAPGRGQVAFAGALTPVQVAQLFAQADVNGDGLLSRAEALRLPFVTMSFEDMDTNRDGEVSRSEYDASLR